MPAETPERKVTGVLPPADKPLPMKQVVDGIYVVAENPYTERYGFFESSGLYNRTTHRTPERGREGPTGRI